MRYAIYFTPPRDDALTEAAAAWLGRDAFSGADTGGAAIGEMSQSLVRYHLAAPRRYGFHGTIVAPFRPADGVGEDDVLAALSGFCASERTFEIPSVELKALSTFLALMPSQRCTELEAMAERAVRHFRPLQAALDESDIARRNPGKLSARQNEYLRKWGYPYVMEEFRFHMTLSGSLDSETMRSVHSAAHQWFAPFLGRPLAVGGLAAFVEPEPGAPFTVLRHVEFEKRS